MKYRHVSRDGAVVEKTIEDTWRRVARAVASSEKAGERRRWEKEFLSILRGFRFIPGGRILAGAGVSGRKVTLFNCFVMGEVEDSLTGIFDTLKESALTMQAGGGIGVDFSPIRPRGAPVTSIGAEASGPVSFMEVWDAMCRTIMSAGQRRGAMMGVLRCDHPDIGEFITAKRQRGRLTNFNMSVLVSDAFMEAVRNDGPWELKFGGRAWRKVAARQLWEEILRETYDHAEPGVIFIDHMNRDNNLNWIEEIHATNPCGEQPLPPYGSCLLGSLNLTQFVVEPFSERARLDTDELAAVAATALRFLDDTIDISYYPLPEQRAESFAKRRAGLGITGLADALAMCGMRYGSEAAVEAAGQWMAVIERAAYMASSDLAAEKGPFPLFDRRQYLQGGHVSKLPEDIRRSIAEKGMRNALVTSVAPTGTISLLAGNVSSGIEPMFAARYERRLRQPGGGFRSETVSDYAVRLYRELHGEDAPLPDVFVSAHELHWRQHLAMQAAVQKHVDAAISKTINLPEDIPFDEFRGVYERAWELGLKGCTTYRPNPITGSILSTAGKNGANGKGGGKNGGHEPAPASAPTAAVPAGRRQNGLCPACGAAEIAHHEGCETCMACGFSHCG